MKKENKTAKIDIIFSQPRKIHDGFSVIGEVVDAETRERVSTLKKRLVAKDESHIAATKNKIRRYLIAEYKKTYLKTTETENDIYKEAEDFLKRILIQVEKSGYRIKETWTAPETNRMALTYFLNHVMPFLKPFLSGEKAYSLADSEKLKNIITADVKSSKRMVNDTSVARTVGKRMTEIKEILSVMTRCINDFPLIIIPEFADLKGLPANELTKYIDSNVMAIFSKKVADSLTESPANVLATVAMMYGARTAEACGIKPASIHDKGDYLEITIFQQEREGAIIKSLKTPQSRRTMIISGWGYDIIIKSLTIIKSTISNISDNEALIQSRKLNPWIVDLLIKSGFSRFDDIKKDLPLVNSEEPNDISSYILRRNFAGVARNIMGMSLSEVDAQMGHSREKATLSPDEKKEIAKKMKRYCPEGPEQKDNPWTNPLTDVAEQDLSVFSGYKFINDTDAPITYHFSVKAKEANAALVIEADDNNPVDPYYMSEKIQWLGVNRTVMGDTTTME